MKFEQGKVYTHQNMLDLVIFVQQIFPVNENYLKLKVRWFNRRGMDIKLEETIKINKSEFPRWYEWDGQTEDWYYEKENKN